MNSLGFKRAEPAAVWGPIVVSLPPYALNVTVAPVAVKVNVAVPVCAPWAAVAVTAHVPAADAVSDVPDTLHPVVAVE